MAKGRDKNFVSIWFWLFSIIVMAIPLVNVVMTLVWAFTGENESRKNHFKAMIVMFMLIVGVMALLFSLGMIPFVLDKLGKFPSR